MIILACLISDRENSNHHFPQNAKEVNCLQSVGDEKNID